MSSLIEQAAHRLQQLRRAGAATAEVRPAQRLPGGGHAAVAPEPDHLPATPAVESRRVDLDFDALAANGVLVPNTPRSLLRDQYRVVKRPLLRNAMGKGASKLANGNLIMVTSALAGEGKTFTAVNLALSIATELDHTVMLVDADVARPTVAHLLGLAPSSEAPYGPGLLDVLDGSAEMSDALLRTNIDKLTLLPSGTQHPRATEMLASDAMTRLLGEVGRRYPDRIIIFDSPPLLLTTEARVLATHMGQVVVVVRAGETRQADVQSALATIDLCPVRLMLLNGAAAAADGGYGYGYGYAYDQRPSADTSLLDAPTA